MIVVVVVVVVEGGGVVVVGVFVAGEGNERGDFGLTGLKETLRGLLHLRGLMGVEGGVRGGSRVLGC